MRKIEYKLCSREEKLLKSGMIVGCALVMIGFGLGLALFKFVFRLI